jgi:hypothetical protein
VSSVARTGQIHRLDRRSTSLAIDVRTIRRAFFQSATTCRSERTPSRSVMIGLPTDDRFDDPGPAVFESDSRIDEAGDGSAREPCVQLPI